MDIWTLLFQDSVEQCTKNTNTMLQEPQPKQIPLQITPHGYVQRCIQSDLVPTKIRACHRLTTPHIPFQTPAAMTSHTMIDIHRHPHKQTHHTSCQKASMGNLCPNLNIKDIAYIIYQLCLIQRCWFKQLGVICYWKIIGHPDWFQYVQSQKDWPWNINHHWRAGMLVELRPRVFDSKVFILWWGCIACDK